MAKKTAKKIPAAKTAKKPIKEPPKRPVKEPPWKEDPLWNIELIADHLLAHLEALPKSKETDHLIGHLKTMIMEIDEVQDQVSSSEDSE